MGDCYIGHGQERVPSTAPYRMRTRSIQFHTSRWIDITTSNWLVPRDGGVETRDAKFVHALNVTTRCAAVTSGSPAMREAHSNLVSFPSCARQRPTQWQSTSSAGTIRAAERHLKDAKTAG